MVDIAICSGRGCALRDNCKRARMFDTPYDYAYEVEPKYGTDGLCYCPNYLKI